ncbi:hypothetical protein D3C78_1108650 [compost metagenome]
MHSVTVCFVFANHTHKAFNQFNCNLVNTIIVVTVAREFAFCNKIYCDTLFVTNYFHFSIFDRTQRVSSYRQTSDTASHCTEDITVMKRHFNAFVAIFIMHVVNDVECIYIQFSEPFHHWGETFHNFIVIKVFGSDWLIFRTNLCT